VAQLAERLLGKEQVEGSNPSRGCSLPGSAAATATAIFATALVASRTPMKESRDPVCGMKVDPERAPARGTYAGQNVYFCSPVCQRKYEATHRPD
jgi:YHS domain-containing protein